MSERRSEVRIRLGETSPEEAAALVVNALAEKEKGSVKDITPETTWEEYRKRKQLEGAGAEEFLKFVRAKAKARGLSTEDIPEMGELGIVEGSEEARDAFRKVADKAIDRLVTHGIMVKQEGGGYKLKTQSDTDGKACIYLFRLAGIKARITYVRPGEERRGAAVVDTSGREGVGFLEEPMIFYVDHHAKESPSGTSAAEYLYDTLWRAGLIDLDDLYEAIALESAIQFVSAVDNGEYPGMHDPENFLQSDRTMLGLSPFMTFPEIVEFFTYPRNISELVRSYRDPLEPLSEEEIGKWERTQGKTMVERSNEKRALIEASVQAIIDLTSRGYDLESEKLGKILVDVGKKVPMGRDAAFSLGFDTYLAWNPEEESFFLQSRKPLGVDFDQGFVVREKMWLKPRGNEPLKITLKQILDKITDGKLDVRGELAEYLENEGKPVENSTFEGFLEVLEGDDHPEVKSDEARFDGFLEVLEGSETNVSESELENQEIAAETAEEQTILPDPGPEREEDLAEGVNMPELSAEHEEVRDTEDEIGRVMSELREAQRLADERGEETGLREELAEVVASETPNERYRVLKFMNSLKRSWKKIGGWFRRTFG